MNAFHKGYNLELAVTARRVLMLEARTGEDRAKYVWEPQKKFLRDLARSKPVTLTCFTGKPFRFPGHTTGRCLNVYVVNDARAVAYFGTVFSRQANKDAWQFLLQHYRLHYPRLVPDLGNKGPTVIMREKFLCRIPSPARHLSRLAVESAVRSYMRMIEPDLIRLPIAWLPVPEGTHLDEHIWAQAVAAAKQQTREEREKIFEDDETWLS